MSYIGSRRRRMRRGMSGLSSRPYGPSVSHRALGTITEVLIPTMTLLDTDAKPPTKPPPPPPQKRTRVVNGPALQGPPDWYRAMQGASLGDDTPTSGAVQLTDGTTAWQQSMLSTAQQIAASQDEFTKRESFQRWVQIGATLAIPLSAAIWRAIFRGSRGDSF